MVDPISYQVEGGEFVIRIPAEYAGRVLVALEGPAGLWPAGFIFANGVTAGIPREVLSRLSGLHASRAAPCRADRTPPQRGAPAPETPTTTEGLRK